MAISNKDRVSRVLDLLRQALAPYVERQLKAHWGAGWETRLDQSRPHPVNRDRDGKIEWDTQDLLKTIFFNWKEVFKDTLGEIERSYVSELRNVRNDFAHEKPFSSDDAERALDTTHRLLAAIQAPREAEEARKLRVELQRTIFAELARSETRRKTLTLEGTPKAGLKPWREVITPHQDVASGRFVQADFMADLAQVHLGEGNSEYSDPQEFYRRTFLTEGLRGLLTGAMLRLTGKGGDPVVELQTNFGGGKTHSMLALYHLFGAENPAALSGVEELMKEVGVDELPTGRRVVLSGTSLSAAEVDEKADGTVVRTLWGEMAWQLGAAEGFAMVAESDAQGVSPGSAVLKQLLERYSPCLVLIDEWVAYFRGIYNVSETPAGSFETNLTFAQALTEAASATSNALVVATLPASQIEIGGEGGQQALDRLKNTFGRVQSSWRPATADEGFEIVRRRLFDAIPADNYPARDAVVRAFSELYRNNAGEFPSGCSEGDYRRRMEAAYPIHPELFERLYNDWGSLDKFQRTRGVLRLMAFVIHALWDRGDSGLMIMPSSIPMDFGRVESELVRYLDETWHAVIARDVDGPSSVPVAIDSEVPNLGRYSATRRVARTIYLGSAATHLGGNPGIDDRRIRLGCVQPGEIPASFGDALRRLADRATYLYQDGARFWFNTQPSVSRVAEDRAAEQDIHDVWAKVVGLLRADRSRGDFCGVHVAPDGSGDVPDEMETRLVVLGPGTPHAKGADSSRALEKAGEILASRGSAQRLYKNMLVFLAPDEQRLTELEDAVRRLMAWESIVDEHEELNLDAFQKRQAETRKKEFGDTVRARIQESWIWLLAPNQPEPSEPGIDWAPARVGGQDPLAAKVSRKLGTEGRLYREFGAANLRQVLDKTLWTEEDHVGLQKLWEYLACYLYLPRLRDSAVLIDSVQKGISQLVNDTVAYASRFDADKGYYEGLIATGGGSVVIDGDSVVIKPEVAKAQLDAETPLDPDTPVPGDVGDGAATPARPTVDEGPVLPTRFYGSVSVDPDRLGRDAGRIAEEVLQHLTTLPGARVRVTLEIEAKLPEGVGADIQRVVTENSETLKFTSKGFEKE